MFIINSITWNIKFVEPYSDYLRRSDGSLTVGVTDFPKRTVYLSELLKGAFLRKVMAHELTHCFCFSYDIVLGIDEEERMADFIATYGEELIYLLDNIISNIKYAVA
jgi:hypothetical protein